MPRFSSILIFAAAIAALSLAAEPKGNAGAETGDKPATLTEVAIESDGNTWITIRDLGQRPESATWAAPRKYHGTQVWPLPDGDYEIIGRRKGFRDFSQTIHVKAGAPRITLRAICSAAG
jgi:hypothetical protein